MRRSIVGDASRLENSSKVTMKGHKELATHATSLGLIPRANISLQRLCEKQLNVTLDKTEQTSNLGGRLADEEVSYAARDSYASWALHAAMETAGSRLVPDDKVSVGMRDNVVNAGDTVRVAHGEVEEFLEAPTRRRVAAGKKRASVRILELYIPGNVHPFSSEHTPGKPPKTLG